MAKLLHDGLAKMGLELYCPNPSDRLPTVTTIKIPDGFPWAKVNGYLMEKYALEIAGGLGPSAGKVIQARPKTLTGTPYRVGPTHTSKHTTEIFSRFGESE